ncbi:MAG: hypothetical protein ACE5JD_01295 [Candidatus Methylomirabilia bacterium]
MKALYDFVASFIPDEALQERVLRVFCALPEHVQYVIADEFAHALLWNRGRHPGEDPEIAADSLAAEWGFPRPVTPLL